MIRAILVVVMIAVVCSTASAGGVLKLYTAPGDTIATSVADTTSAQKVYGPGGFAMTWAGEDSMSVVVQVTIDGTVWATLLSTGIMDLDTDFMISRNLSLNPVDGAGDIPATLMAGSQARAIITNEGSSTATSVALAWIFQR